MLRRGVIGIVLAFASATARADDPPGTGAPVTDAPAPAPAAPVSAPAPAPARPHHRRFELGFVPFIGGNSDVGLGVGQLSSLTRVGDAPGPNSYRWRLDTGTSIAFKHRASGLVVPIQDYYLKLTIPRLRAYPRLRLEFRVAYTDESAVHFRGFGNASPEPDHSRPREDYEFRRQHPNAIAEARYRVRGPWYLALGDVLALNRLDVRPTTVLSDRRTNGSPIERALLAEGFGTHLVELVDLSAQYDTRDREISTRTGQWHSAKVRLSPHLGRALPYGYGRLTLIARGYLNPTPRLSLSARLVGDALFGSPPFYELARVEEYAAIGGGNAIRGVPAQHFYGKAKLFGNVEARTEVLRFCIHGKPMALAVALFVDAGRTWTELTTAHPELDGTGLGLHYGLGGGLRWRQGSSFVVRADVAWSPDAHPIGAYFTAGEIF
ncbi:MAG: outer membrane protein assembly factor [Deltaproteobacteria bacterium]|nr:outer membrane protein assembly factor [Deltaproteobacteria bacterium]